jgi:hypothetical protein
MNQLVFVLFCSETCLERPLLCVRAAAYCRMDGLNSCAHLHGVILFLEVCVAIVFAVVTAYPQCLRPFKLPAAADIERKRLWIHHA